MRPQGKKSGAHREILGKERLKKKLSDRPEVQGGRQKKFKKKVPESLCSKHKGGGVALSTLMCAEKEEEVFRWVSSVCKKGRAGPLLRWKGSRVNRSWEISFGESVAAERL